MSLDPTTMLSFALKNLFVYSLSFALPNINLLDRFSIGLVWSAVFFTFYWITCFVITTVDYYWYNIPLTNREGSQFNNAESKKILLQVLFNQLIVTPLYMLCTTYTLATYRSFWLPTLPIYITIPLFVLFADLFFWILHRISHLPFFYINFHKQHHEIKHRYAAAAIYCHPLEMWMVNLLSGALPAFLVGFDDSMILVVVAASAIDTTIAHSRWSAKHFLHHKETMKLFGTSLGVVDLLLDTDYIIDYSKVKHLKEKWDGNNVSGNSDDDDDDARAKYYRAWIKTELSVTNCLSDN